jgi:predicted  nucleic acid-binding Zn-ribbon protein
MSHECENCGAVVSHRYYRVLAVEGEVRACPDCGGSHISDPTAYGGGEHTTASRGTRSGRIGGGR